MTTLRRTNTGDPQFVDLVSQLTAMLSVLNGERDAYYAPLNVVGTIPNAVVVTVGDEPVGCGAFRVVNATTVEIKRMFVKPEHRGRGVARVVLEDLELWASELGFEFAILETSRRLIPAVGLYTSHGYHLIPNYGAYVGMEDSICYEKCLVG